MIRPQEVQVSVSPDVSFRNSASVGLIAGPCVIESPALVLRMARDLKRITRGVRVPFIFKASYDKANRSSIASFRGPGLTKGLEILQWVKEKTGCAILTDVHCREDVTAVAAVADVIQVPAFLCRQTDLLLACGDSGRVVNIKKGQFMAPWDMERVIRKVESTGNRRILLTERGSSFGYNNLVVDMRALSVMKQWGYPVIFDATHSVQLPGALGYASGGQREFIWPLTRAAVAVGVSAIFCEVHPHPAKALSDASNCLPLRAVSGFLKAMRKLDAVAKTIREPGGPG